MQIKVEVILVGNKKEIKSQAIVDTGAGISFIPEEIAKHIEVRETGQSKNIVGIHGDVESFPVVTAYLEFPSLKKPKSEFCFVMSDKQKKIIIGLDILKLTGISIDTETGQLTIKKKIWEAFKTIAGTGLVIYGGIKVLRAMFDDDSDG